MSDLLLLELKSNQSLTDKGWLQFSEQITKVLDEKLYRKYGYPSFKAFIRAEIPLAPRLVYSRIKVFRFLKAYNFNDDTLSIGASKLDLIAAYAMEGRNKGLPKQQVNKLLEMAPLNSFENLKVYIENLKNKTDINLAYRVWLPRDDHEVLKAALSQQREALARQKQCEADDIPEKQALLAIVAEWSALKGNTDLLRLSDIMRLIGQ
jgi:hypothetical protein